MCFQAFNTVSSTVSSVVQGAPIQNLPLNGRDTLQLALTQPGVTPMTITSTGFAGNGFSIAGGRANSVTYTLDGGVMTYMAGRKQYIVVPVGGSSYGAGWIAFALP